MLELCWHTRMFGGEYEMYNFFIDYTDIDFIEEVVMQEMGFIFSFSDYCWKIRFVTRSSQTPAPLNHE